MARRCRFFGHLFPSHFAGGYESITRTYLPQILRDFRHLAIARKCLNVAVTIRNGAEHGHDNIALNIASTESGVAMK